MNQRQFIENFQKPPKDYSPVPLWFWYGRLDKDKLSLQIDEMVDKGVYNAFMHPRAYLLTPYLEEAWWDVVDHVVKYSQEKGFHPWLYDEYAWPSGTAGSTFLYSAQKPSRVLAEGECNMAKGLKYKVISLNDKIGLESVFHTESNEPIAVVFWKSDESGNIIDSSLKIINEQSELPSDCSINRFHVMAFYRYVIPTAVDYLNKETIRSFMQYTHEQYRKRYGKYFGTLIPGLFFDEIYNAANQIVWTDGFEQEFISRRGYSIIKYLPLLINDGGKLTAQIRKDYYSVVAELYEEAFFQQIGQWCDENNLQFTGHTEEEIKQHPLRQGNYFLTMRHLRIPGGDCHDYRYKYPRKITPIEPKGAVSVARLNGRKRMMSEAMGGGGWATTLQEFKRGVNVLAVMGINFFVLHGFYYETEHQGSQADWPASFFFQNPYWKHFKIFADYISRLSFMGTVGKPVCRVGLLYPIQPIYERFQDGAVTAEGNKIADIYHSILNMLLSNQIDTDIIDEQNVRNAKLNDGKLESGSEQFEVILVPDTSGIEEKTVLKLRQFAENGGFVIFYDCGDSVEISSSFPNVEVIRNPDTELIEAVRNRIEPDFRIVSGDSDGVFVSHRNLHGMDYYLIVNSCDEKKNFTALFQGNGTPVRYNPETGKHSGIIAYTRRSGGYFQIKEELMEDEAFFLVFEQSEEEIPKALNFKPLQTRKLSENWSVIPLTDNYHVPQQDTYTQIELPVARFCSQLDLEWKDIRIQNRKGEPGNCGKLLSMWKGRWITRRPTWSDDSCEKNLFFRKIMVISGQIERAQLCIAAVGNFELYVNGKFAFSGTGWRSPTECDVTEFVRTGENLFAVSVRNETPVQGKNMLETEQFDPDTLTSLLLEGFVNTDKGIFKIQSDESWVTCSACLQGWKSPELKAEISAEKINVKEIAYPWEREYPEKWLFAWERGTPPILPWGRLPLFGTDVEFPVKLTYQLVVPVGAKKVCRPVVRGNFHCRIDGKEIRESEWKEGSIEISDFHNTHLFEILVVANHFSDGLEEPLKVNMVAMNTQLGDWRKVGLPYYSGSMAYQNEFILDDLKDGTRCILDLGSVHFHAEVWVNGKLAGVKLWKPYQVDLTELVLPGVNKLTIVVSNLIANKMRCSLLEEGRALGWNRYWYEENIDRDSQNLESGLFGPVTINIIYCSEI